MREKHEREGEVWGWSVAGERKDRDGKDNGLEALVEFKIFKLGFYSE